MTDSSRKPLAVAFATVALAALLPIAGALAAVAPFPEFLDPNPNPRNEFGKQVVFLSNGNVVVTSPKDDYDAIDTGAVYLFNGTTGALIASLRGSSAGDQVGSGGVVALSNGNFVVLSPSWDNLGVVNAGAVTWCSGTTGAVRVVSSANSLVGSSTSDRVGSGGVTALPNGHCVVVSDAWSNGAIAFVGAVTWMNGNTGRTGAVSSGNSLVGGTTQDFVGNAGVTVVGGSHYVVGSPSWQSGAANPVGAATWCNGATGRTGVVSAANSLVGAASGDDVGSTVVALTNGNYVVACPGADNGALSDAGAATFALGASGVTGTISSANSLVGAKALDNVGAIVTPLTNGNYVVASPNASNGALAAAGAVTWCSGTTGRTGAIAAANSLQGSTALDAVGSGGVLALANGHYVVLSPFWDNGAVADAGAATWCNGTTGRTGALSSANSTTSNQAQARVGTFGVALTNGNYVTGTTQWDNGGTNNAGAVTWGNGTFGTNVVVSAANSLVGSFTNDLVGVNGLTALPNGNYVVSSPNWDNGAASNAGAVTWCNGATGRFGTVSAANSLVGSATSDNVGSDPILALPNGSYVVRTPSWSSDVLADVGAITWGSAGAGISGPISAANSWVGSSANDHVGDGAAIALTDGNFVVGSSSWRNGALAGAGAATWGSGTGGNVGAISTANSIVGTAANDNVGAQLAALPDGSWVIVAPQWDNGSMADAGAVRWVGVGPVGTGTITQTNSVFGFTASAGFSGIAIDSTNSGFAASFLTDAGGRVRRGPLPAFTLASVVDIAADQGGWVRVTFTRSPYDDALTSTPVTSYGVWRRLPGSAPQFAAAPVADDATLASIRASLGPDVVTTTHGGSVVANVPGGSANGAMPAGTWELVANVPAFMQPTYLAAVPTVSNLTGTEFVVTAHTTSNVIWFTTGTVLGQSADNLAPAQPSPFTGAYASGNTHLTWGANTENDLAGYRLYRGSSAGFTPSLANRIATPSGTTYDDAITGAYVYKLTATDVNGNESTVATVIPTGTTGVDDGPVAFALDGVRPNPASGRALNVVFALPVSAPAKLELLDVSGRRVAVRDVGVMGAGRHTVNLSEARAIPAGLYWARLTQGAMQRSVRVAVVE